jgi:hypothetical protein
LAYSLHRSCATLDSSTVIPHSLRLYIYTSIAIED